MMKIRDVMTHGVITVTEVDGAGEVAQQMRDLGIRHLPVLRDGKLIGMVSERDLFARRVRETDIAEVQSVREVMEAVVEFATPEDGLDMAARRMAALRIGSLPVVENDGIVGIVTATDLLANMGEIGNLPLAGVVIADVMTPDPEIVAPNDPLVSAAGRLVENEIRHLPVVDEDGFVLGMLSDRDIRTVLGDPVAALRESTWEKLDTLTVAEAMTVDPMTVHMEEGLARPIRLMVSEKIGALPVVDDSDRLVGIVSYIDLLGQRVQEPPTYGYLRTFTERDFDEVLEEVPRALAAEGFGVLTEIDMQATLKSKLGADINPYRILGACNPPLAHEALQHEPSIGLLLPCNVSIRQTDNGAIEVGVVSAMEMFRIAGNPRLADTARRVETLLKRALDRL